MISLREGSVCDTTRTVYDEPATKATKNLRNAQCEVPSSCPPNRRKSALRTAHLVLCPLKVVPRPVTLAKHDEPVHARDLGAADRRAVHAEFEHTVKQTRSVDLLGATYEIQRSVVEGVRRLVRGGKIERPRRQLVVSRKNDKRQRTTWRMRLGVNPHEHATIG